MGEIFAGAIIVAVVAAAAAIAAGYYSFFLAIFPENSTLAVAATLIVFSCLVVFIRNSGYEFTYILTQPNRKRSVGPFILWYLLLFMLSAAGVIRFAMFYFEGPEIAREKTGELMNNYSTFGASTDKIFDSPQWIAFEKEARARFVRIVSEMDNQMAGYCGVGTVARQEIDELHGILPGFGYLNGSSDPNILSCRDRLALDRVLAQYKTLFENSLKQSSKRAELRIEDRASYKQLANLAVNKNYGVLEDLKEKLNKSVTFLFDTSLFDISLNNLQRANDDYGKIYDLGSQFSDLPTIGIKGKLSIESLRELQSSTGVFAVVFQRILQSGPRAAFFLIIALGLDFLLVFLTCLGYRKALRIASVFELQRNRILPASDVTYLWVVKQ
jgi:hypothetical protein